MLITFLVYWRESCTYATIPWFNRILSCTQILILVPNSRLKRYGDFMSTGKLQNNVPVRGIPQLMEPGRRRTPISLDLIKKHKWQWKSLIYKFVPEPIFLPVQKYVLIYTNINSGYPSIGGPRKQWNIAVICKSTLQRTSSDLLVII